MATERGKRGGGGEEGPGQDAVSYGFSFIITTTTITVTTIFFFVTGRYILPIASTMPVNIASSTSSLLSFFCTPRGV